MRKLRMNERHRKFLGFQWKPEHMITLWSNWHQVKSRCGGKKQGESTLLCLLLFEWFDHQLLILHGITSSLGCRVTNRLLYSEQGRVICQPSHADHFHHHQCSTIDVLNYSYGTNCVIQIMSLYFFAAFINCSFFFFRQKKTLGR